MPKSYTLRLMFDPSQLSDVLQFDLFADTQSAEHLCGRYAGTYVMDEGDTLDIQIIAINDPQIVKSGQCPVIEVVDLTLVCSPAAGIDQPDLSPYDPNSAGFYISEWDPPVEIPVPADSSYPKGATAVMYQVTHPFTVVSKMGQWQTSGYLSAKITPPKREIPNCRVYVFDPIVVVRGGGGMP